MKVEVESLPADTQPVTVTMEEWMRRMKDMSKLGGGMSFYGSMPDSYKVSVNGNHKIIGKILSSDETTQSTLAKQLVDLALLSQGLLKGAALTSFGLSIVINIEKPALRRVFCFNHFRRPAQYDAQPVNPVSSPDCKPEILAALQHFSTCPHTSV
jgi:hypothetical protein